MGESEGMWRSFDVGAVVESLPFRGTLVAAGADGMERRVRRARLATTPEHLRRAGESELVVTAAATLAATGEDWEQLVARFDEAQVAGLAVRLEPATPGGGWFSIGPGYRRHWLQERLFIDV